MVPLPPSTSVIAVLNKNNKWPSAVSMLTIKMVLLNGIFGPSPKELALCSSMLWFCGLILYQNNFGLFSKVPNFPDGSPTLLLVSTLALCPPMHPPFCLLWVLQLGSLAPNSMLYMMIILLLLLAFKNQYPSWQLVHSSIYLLFQIRWWWVPSFQFFRSYLVHLWHLIIFQSYWCFLMVSEEGKIPLLAI